MENQKQKVALAAAALVESGQVVGLGTGSTVAYAIKELGRRAKEDGLKIECVSTSFDTSFLAEQASLHCLSLEHLEQVDISIDGADEIDGQFCLLKGGGGSHTREKIVHAMSKRFVVIADSSKRVKRLGERFPIPIEILPSAKSFVCSQLRQIGAYDLRLRTSQGKRGPLFTDNGNWIIDARFFIEDPAQLEQGINQICGVLENGVFAKICPQAKDCFIA